MSDAGANVGVVALIVVGLLIYFLPTIVAANRRHRQAGAIFLLNLLLGWSLIGWVVAIVWAATNSGERTPPAKASVPATSEAEELERFAALREKGVLTDAEFEAKKRAILAR